MTIESAAVVGLEPTAELSQLISDLQSARARATKAIAGERSDIERFEALCTQAEQLAVRSLATARLIEIAMPTAASILIGDDAAHWSPGLEDQTRQAASELVASGLVPILVASPFTSGPTTRARSEFQAAPPLDRWESDGSHGRRAVEDRFRSQITEALSEAADGVANPRAISPSGVQNTVVTEILREFVAGSTAQPVRVPVEYRDGSRSTNPMALRSLALNDRLPSHGQQLRFSLLSIRHTEMDVVVDGAWLRNAEISRPRPAAETDDLVYDITREQLDELTRQDEQLVLYLYQTGLETAVVGFYKALVDHLLESPHSIAVQPMFFSGGRPRRRRSKNKTKKRRTVVETSSEFRKGTPWAM